MYSLTKDAMSLGLIGLAEVIPAFGFAFIAGYFVDKRIKAKRLSILYFFIRSEHSLMIAITSGMASQRLSVHSLELCVYAVMFISAVSERSSLPLPFRY